MSTHGHHLHRQTPKFLPNSSCHYLLLYERTITTTPEFTVTIFELNRPFCSSWTKGVHTELFWLHSVRPGRNICMPNCSGCIVFVQDELCTGDFQVPGNMSHHCTHIRLRRTVWRGIFSCIEELHRSSWMNCVERSSRCIWRDQ